MASDPEATARGEVDPEEFLAALLRISPEGAATARENAAATVKREDKQRAARADDEN